MSKEEPLKARNVAWIWAVIVADVLALVAVAFPSAAAPTASWFESGAYLGGASIAPVVVLLLTSLLSANSKAVLVFWRVRDALPGHRAFSEYAPKDPRVDMGRLRAALGDLPVAPHDQNTLWYRFLKKLEVLPNIAEEHRNFLLFRDLAALSFLLALVAPALLYFLGAGGEAIAISFALFAVQYIATVIAARNHGIGLVCNVLAAISAKSATTSGGATNHDS